MAKNMKQAIMFVCGIVCTFIVVVQIFLLTFDFVHSAMDSYVDCRVRVIVQQQVRYIYEDLQTLHPHRVYQSRHGAWHVSERYIAGLEK